MAASNGRVTTTSTRTGPTANLVLATTGFALAFWGWALLSPLGPSLQERLGLSAEQLSLLVAVPVVVGSLGRIPVGALTDRFGARAVLPAVCLVSVLPVLYLGLLAESYTSYLVGGFFLGVAGTAFAVGVPLVSAWYPPERKGFAVGVFGAGMGGTAISAFTTVRLSDAVGEAFPFVLVAVLLTVYGVVGAVLIRDAPTRPTPPPGSVLARTWRTMRLGVTVRASAMYALGFGGFVAFSVYLPTYLKNAYELSQEGAALRTAGFVVLAVLMRPTGGWLSDRFGPLPVLSTCFAVVTVLAAAAALHPPLEIGAGAVFLGLAGALGAAAGAAFAYVAKNAEPSQVGAVTGVVGACGGLGGFVPPLVMGSVFAATGGYGPGLWALAAVAAAAALWTSSLQRSGRRAAVGGMSVTGR
jgi:NNP family nitrate/nitrite transporter-like MFS transporter